MDKTNVMRILEQHNIAYTPHAYPHGKCAVDGEVVAALIGKPCEVVFKTLVARGKSGAHQVFVIPVAHTLDLKKAARAAGEKAVELVPVKALLGLTGYVRGGCSPVGMKKQFATFFDQSARALESMVVSAGKIGYQVECSPEALRSVARAQYAPLTTA